MLELDVFSFDRLVEVASEVHNASLLQLTHAMTVAANVGFSGEQEPLDNLATALAPPAKKAETDKKAIAENIRRVQQLFGS